MLDTKKFNNKPTGYETGGVQKRIKQTEIEISELASGLCNGMTCKPALLNGTKSVDWIEQQVFMLDFDEGTTIEEELNNCDRLGIKPVFAYTSFSHSEEEHRFRIVFVADEVIRDVDKRNKLQTTLINTFDKSDKVTFDCTRIFYGGKGKEPIAPNYDARINADEIINKYYKEEYEIKKSSKSNVNKGNKQSTNQVSINSRVDSDNENINAIRGLDADKLRELIGEQLESNTNKKDIKNLILSVLDSSYECKSEQQVYDTINSIDIHSILGINDGEMINCILPNHNDNTPSAHIYTTDSGTQVYKCFGCGKALTIIGLVEVLARCKRHVAIKFIKEVYNIKLIQSDWVKEQKELMIQSANYLDTEEFKIQFPNVSKLIRTRKLHIQQMLVHFTQYINDDMQYDDKPLFYASYNTLMKVCDIKDRTRLSQSLTLFTLLNMLSKVELNCIPEEELNKAKHISAKYGFKKLTNFYQFEEYGYMTLEDSEEIAKILIDNNISLRGLSREYILRTFGIEVANKVYPQYKFENKRGTSDKSDRQTLEIGKFILDEIKKKGYMLEKDVKINSRVETQWKRSIQEILDAYGLAKVRASKVNKELYNIPSDIPYQSNVIVREINN